MTAHDRGDVVLVGFVFTDGAGRKLRPAVVVSTSAYHRARQEVIVAAITGNSNRRLFGDHVISDWKGTGLLFPSLVTGVIRTIRQTMIGRKLGTLSRRDLEAVDRTLRRCLGLS